MQPYPEDPAVYKPLSQEDIQRIKNEKKQKQNEKKQKVTENRKHLASVRVVQRNLVFVVGLSQRLADPEVSKTTDPTWDTGASFNLFCWAHINWNVWSLKSKMVLNIVYKRVRWTQNFVVSEIFIYVCILPSGPKTTRVFWEIWENP